MAKQTRNLRIESYRPLAAPADLLGRLPLGERAAATVRQARAAVMDSLTGHDDRLIVVVGPCSIHDPDAALDYAHRLRELSNEVAAELHLVMRVYFEKPRSTLGWKGMINDPYLDGTYASNEGLHLARRLLLDLGELGMPAGCEFIDPISPQYIADAVTWGAIGARTTESQIHRQLASGLSMPIGFKNGTDGGVQVALDALRAAAAPHIFFGVTEEGSAAIVSTQGNSDCHVILRGGRNGPNYDAVSVQNVLTALHAAGLPQRVMIDVSHGNSGKDHRRQPVVLSQVAAQIARGEAGIIGVMIESFLAEGRQDLLDRDSLTYGQSITDACIGWDTTALALRELADAVRTRRAALASRAALDEAAATV